MIRFPWRRPSRATSVEPQTGEPGVVRGERAGFIARGARSLQSRMTSLLAAGLMTSVGAGMLAWYYAEALSRPAPARMPMQASLPAAAGEGMTLPTFEAIAAPRLPRFAGSAESLPSASSAPPLSGEAQAPRPAPLPSDPLLEPQLYRVPGGLARVYGSSPQSIQRQQVPDRRLSGEVFAGAGSSASSNLTSTGIGDGQAAALPIGDGSAQAAASLPGADALQTLLRPSVLSAVRAQILPTQRLLLPKGTFIDCTLVTAIDSTLPGMTTCITATDTFGADGSVVLLERGTKLIGETRGDVQQGAARVFVVWTEARTPSGVVVQLDSPGTDALGRSGLDGEVNRHFWQRFGAALLVSTIDGVVQSEVQSSSRSGTVVLDPTASEDVVNDILRSTVNIPPTIRVRNGARIQVLVARDVDFRSVYELESR
jgi:type IV secretion system protein VirB10